MSISYNYDQENKNPYSAKGPERTPTKKTDPEVPEWLPWLIIGILLLSGAWFIGIPWLLVKLFGSDKKKSATQAPPLRQQTVQTGSSAEKAEGSGEKKATAAEKHSAAKEKQEAAKEKVKETTIGSLTKPPKDGSWSRILLVLGGGLLGFAGIGSFLDAAGSLESGVSLGGLFELCMGFAFLAGAVAMVYSAFASRNAQKRYKRFVTIIGRKQAVEISSLASITGLKERRVRRDLQNMVDKGYFGPNAYLNEELGYLFLSSQADEALQSAREAASLAEEASQAARTPDLYENILQQIRDVNNRIPDAVMTAKIDTIENVTRLIFREVQKEPSKLKKIDRFLNYYLPTTLKLLESYAQLDKTGLESDNVAESMASIEGAMDSIVKGFENLLDSLYDTNVVDIKSDIDVMQQMMRSDGTVVDKDFRLG